MFRTLCLILSVLLLTLGCGSSQPTAPVASVAPSPAPAPGNPPPAPAAPGQLPVPERNTVFLAAPAPPQASTDATVGRYSLDIGLTNGSGPRCTTVPEDAKRRTYTADITSRGDYYAVLLYDARFLRDASNLGFGCADRRLDMNGVCHQFLMNREGASNVSTSIVSEDEWRGSEIWEVLPDGRLLQLTGVAYGSFEDGQIRASGKGNAWYGRSLPTGDSEYGACEGEITLAFTKR
jgi:hypothetical protein